MSTVKTLLDRVRGTAVPFAPTSTNAATDVERAIKNVETRVATIEADYTDDMEGPAASVDSEVALFSGITGKLLKRASISGLAKLTSGVLSAAAAGTDYQAPIGTIVGVAKGNGANALTAAVEGTDFWKPGGTDVAVADGGTGASTAANARTNLGLGTGDSPQFTAIELGNASDTTLARASAGQATLEGVQIPLGPCLLIPQGRLTVTTATPIISTNTTAQTTVYYTPYNGRLVPLYDGTNWRMHDVGAELSQATTDATKSPAACTTNSNYDLFVWLDSGTYRCTRGPAWSSATSRGTGAGTTELSRVNGIYTNAVAITNGPAANRGLYVGTIRTNGSSQVDMRINGDAASTAHTVGVWNMYNRVGYAVSASFSTASWTYASATVRAINGSSTSRIQILTGLAEDPLLFTISGVASGTAGFQYGIGPGMDTTTAFDGICNITPQVTGQFPAGSFSYNYTPQIGFHYVSVNEFSPSGTSTAYGASNLFYALGGRC